MITRTGPIVNHASATNTASIEALTRRRIISGAARSTIATIATSGTIGVGSMNRAGTNTSIVGYVQALATGNLTRSTITHTTRTRTKLTTDSDRCHGASAARRAEIVRKVKAPAPLVTSSRF